MSSSTELKSRVIETKLLNWRLFQFIQQDNFKELSPAASDKLKKSILENNFTQPFYVWRDPETEIIYCLDGKHRTMILEQLIEDGHDVPYLLPATFIDCRDKKEAAKLVLIYSSMYARITEIGLMDFMAMHELDFDQLKFEIDLPGLENEDFESFREQLEAKEDDYLIPYEIITDIQEGDLFEIGPHRLLCGDCRSKAEVARLMDGQLLDLVVTDPPYNVDYKGKNEEERSILNDNMETEAFYDFLLGFYQAFAEFTKPGGAWYVWHADSEGMNFRKAFIDAGLMLKQCLVWVKNAIVLGRQDYQWKHEPCLYGWKPGAGHYFVDDRTLSTVIADDIDLERLKKDELLTMIKQILSETKTTVLNHDRPLRNDVHPTMKPVLLIASQISNSSKPNQNVGDGFGGSGTTMVASHQLKRKCFMMELDPKYCQVIIDRMLQLEPTIEIKKNAVPYGEMVQL